VFVKTEGDPKAVIAAVGEQVKSIDPSASVFAETLEGLMTNSPSFVFSRIGAIFASAIGLLGLFLAAVGIYGMVSFAVIQRTPEVGIRMALGATQRDVLSLVLHQSMKPVVLGLLLGTIGAAAASQLLKVLLFDVSALDPSTFTGVALFLALMAALASYIPARRATKVDPMVALRYE